MERVQHCATRMIPRLAKLDFDVRLEKMDLPSLTFSRARGDAIETYKYLHGFYTVDSSHMLPLHTTDGVTTRGHSLQLPKRNCMTQLRMNFFGLRTVNSWDQLPERIAQGHRPPQSTSLRDYMTGITPINVTRIDTSSRSIYRPHCLRRI